MLKEFREFAIKGNVVDIAVGLVVGTAFGAIVSSLVSDVIMPPIGLVLGNVDFSNLFVILKEGTPPGPYPSLADVQKSGAVTINYGIFLNKIISFIIVAFAMFLLIRTINRLKRQEAPPPANTRNCQYCFSSINIKATRCPNCTSELKER